MKKNIIKNTKQISKNYCKYKTTMNVIDTSYNTINNLFFKKQHKKKKIIFFSKNYHKKLISQLKKHHDVELLVFGLKDRLFAITHKRPYSDISYSYFLFNNYLNNNDPPLIQNVLNNIKTQLIKIKPDYIVLTNDTMPIERIIIQSCKELNIPSIVIQHGIYNAKNRFIDGMFANYILVWGQYFKDVYLKQGRKEKDIFVFGYPNTKNIDNKNKNKKRNIYYISQNLEKYFEILKLKTKTINQINEICIKNNMLFYYRPHPSENRIDTNQKFPRIKLCKKEKIESTIKNGDIFISFNSTALIDASINNKTTIQLLTYPIQTDNFEKLGGCTKTLKNIEELSIYLKNITKTKQLPKTTINNNYIETTKSPINNFLEILKKIEK